MSLNADTSRVIDIPASTTYEPRTFPLDTVIDLHPLQSDRLDSEAPISY